MKQYACLVDGCPKKFMDPGKRRLHLIDKHKYPRDYAFSLTAMPRQGRRGQIYLPPAPGAPRPTTAPTDAPEMAVDAGKVDTAAVVDMAVVIEAVAVVDTAAVVEAAASPVLAAPTPPLPSAPFVPRQIAFGRGGGRARMFGTGSTSPNRYVDTFSQRLPKRFVNVFSFVPLAGMCVPTRQAGPARSRGSSRVNPSNGDDGDESAKWMTGETDADC